MPFRIALNMAGAVSAGAYTAGVLDFLVEALDAWYDARDAQRKQNGDDAETWNIPAHDVLLEALTGASAGGMCAAISAVALQEEFVHVRQANPPEDAPVNRLYQSWVRSIDIVPLLGTADLPNGQGPVRSILDSTPISDIANGALVSPVQRRARPWVADPLSIAVTLSDLRGIPYSVDEANQGSFEERIAYHADQIRFAVSGQVSPGTATAIGLNCSDPHDPEWPTLRLAAMATGAFPLMLASRVISRSRDDYANRPWIVSNATPSASGQCESAVKIPPAWDASAVPAAFDNVYVDGGVTNNNPFELARQYLLEAAGNPGGHNPRTPEAANAAVISVAPFPGDEPFDRNYDGATQAELLNVANALLGTLISQSRFQGEDLRLTRDPDVSSRFVVAPSDDSVPQLPALLCAALGAFGGFVDRPFRDHDYQLGRRNCQQFLRTSFVLPEDNVAIAPGVNKKPEILDAFRTEYGNLDGGRWWYPVIPLMPALRTEIKAPPREECKTTLERLEQVAEAATNRLQAVLHGFITEPEHQHGGWSFLINSFFDLGGRLKIKGMILDTLRTELAKTQQA
ncbi:MAG: hypothetical protein ABSF98_28185 [Bryobacteraceae bacterium]